MSDEFNSPNEPLFFLHHGNLDYLWALWEEQDLKRLTDYSKLPGDIFDAETQLDMGLFAPPRKAKHVMDTLNRDGKGVLCFKYEGLGMKAYTE
jgi:tyrosinase